MKHVKKITFRGAAALVDAEMGYLGEDSPVHDGRVLRPLVKQGFMLMSVNSDGGRVVEVTKKGSAEALMLAEHYAQHLPDRRARPVRRRRRRAS